MFGLLVGPERVSRGKDEQRFPSSLYKLERTFSMQNDVFSIGSHVQISSYGPFRGLRGTIRTIHCLPPLEEPLCFYHIALEGTPLKEAIWFREEEVQPLASHAGLFLTSESKSA